MTKTTSPRQKKTWKPDERFKHKQVKSCNCENHHDKTFKKTKPWRLGKIKNDRIFRF